MRTLIISSNTLPASPSGPAYIAGAVRAAGHEVRFFETLFAEDLEAELGAELAAFRPDVVGLSIRLVFGDVQDAGAPFGTRHLDLRARVREIVDIVRRCSTAVIVLGGPGFNYYARDWLTYLDLDYGIRGEGEVAFPMFLDRLARGGDVGDVPGCVCRVAGAFRVAAPQPVADLDTTALPAYDLCDLDRYAARHITPAVFTKRGCAFNCTYCPYSKLEGKCYRLKSPERVLAEIGWIRAHSAARRVMFCDNNFNAPRSHAEAICRALSAGPTDMAWGTGDLRPAGVTDGFCRLMTDSGCFYANLSIESASATMLRSMRRGYTVGQVQSALGALSRSPIPFSASLMLGAPGETPETVAESLAVLADYDIPLGVWVTIGVYLWTDYQDVVGALRTSGALTSDRSLFDGPVYVSPTVVHALPERVPAIKARSGYTVQVNHPQGCIVDWQN